jgi:DNA-binding LytR/AlgR family response regulator
MKDENENQKLITLINLKKNSIEHKVAEIIFFEVYGNYAYMQKTRGDKQFVNTTLKELGKMPELALFVRINPKILVNPGFYEDYNKETKICTFFKDYNFTVSRRIKPELSAKIRIVKGDAFNGL